jgi:hypothetical protein
MAVYQENRYRRLALLVSSYSHQLYDYCLSPQTRTVRLYPLQNL